MKKKMVREARTRTSCRRRTAAERGLRKEKRKNKWKEVIDKRLAKVNSWRKEEDPFVTISARERC